METKMVRSPSSLCETFRGPVDIRWTVFAVFILPLCNSTTVGRRPSLDITQAQLKNTNNYNKNNKKYILSDLKTTTKYKNIKTIWRAKPKKLNILSEFGKKIFIKKLFSSVRKFYQSCLK